MCRAVQRHPFIRTNSSDPLLPTTFDSFDGPGRMSNRRINANATGGRFSAVFGMSSLGRSRSASSVEQRQVHALSKQKAGSCSYSSHSFRTIMTSWALYLLLLALGALMYQQSHMFLNQLRQIRSEISTQLLQIRELTSYADNSGKTSASRDKDRDNYLFYLEHYRLNMHQGIQLISQRMLIEKYVGSKFRTNYQDSLHSHSTHAIFSCSIGG